MTFKKDDYVLCVNYPNSYNFTSNTMYKVREDYNGEFVRVYADDIGNPNGLVKQYFINLGKSSEISNIEKLFYNIK